ncbi:unnamed protein product [Merluccius merluccius]
MDLGPDRNWKGIGISLLVIVLVLSLIGLAIVLLSKDDGSKSIGSQLTLDDLFDRHFQVHDPDAKWISGNCTVAVPVHPLHISIVGCIMEDNERAEFRLEIGVTSTISSVSSERPRSCTAAEEVRQSTSALFFAVMCCRGDISAVDASRGNKLVRKASLCGGAGA